MPTPAANPDLHVDGLSVPGAEAEEHRDRPGRAREESGSSGSGEKGRGRDGWHEVGREIDVWV
ncbi:MAG: hypothetical protein D6681_05505, partial [Calditrichaeota bacterium]